MNDFSKSDLIGLKKNLDKWRKEASSAAMVRADQDEIPSEQFFRGAVAAYDRVLNSMVWPREEGKE